MPKKRQCRGPSELTPIHVVMIPLIPVRVMDDREHFSRIAAGEDINNERVLLTEMHPSIRELVENAKESIKTVTNKIRRSNPDHQVYQKLVYLGSSEEGRDLRAFAERLSLDGSVLYVAAHGHMNGIGASESYGISPEELSELLSYTFDESSLAGIKEIRLLTCNSGYHPSGYEQSYAGRLYRTMKAHGASSLTVQGYLGYLEEDGRNRHTYVTSSLGSARETKQRIDTQAVSFLPDDQIESPKRPITPRLQGGTYDRDAGFKAINDNLLSLRTPSTPSTPSFFQPAPVAIGSKDKENVVHSENKRVDDENLPVVHKVDADDNPEVETAPPSENKGIPCDSSTDDELAEMMATSLKSL